MNKVLLMPQNLEVWLTTGASLTDIEFELYKQEIIPFGCKVGVCGACVIEVLEGASCLGQKSDDELLFLSELGYSGNEFRLACQCRINGSVKIKPVAA